MHMFDDVLFLTHVVAQGAVTQQNEITYDAIDIDSDGKRNYGII